MSWLRVRWTSTAIDQDYTIPELNALLEARDIDVSRLVWDAMRSARGPPLTAQFRPNQQYDVRSEPSSLVLRLREAPWVATKGGELLVPAEVTRDELHPSFVLEDTTGWLEAIGFGEKEKERSAEHQERQKAASELGVPLELVDRLSSVPEERRSCAETTRSWSGGSTGWRAR